MLGIRECIYEMVYLANLTYLQRRAGHERNPERPESDEDFQAAVTKTRPGRRARGLLRMIISTS
jgi:hypothetical protein